MKDLCSNPSGDLHGPGEGGENSCGRKAKERSSTGKGNRARDRIGNCYFTQDEKIGGRKKKPREKDLAGAGEEDSSRKASLLFLHESTTLTWNASFLRNNQKDSNTT